MDRFPRSDSIVQPRAGLQTYMAQVYGWMTVGLLLTAFVAWYAANSAAVMELLFTNRVFLIGLIIAQLALVIVLSAMIQKLSAGVTTMLFMLYSALTGLTLSSIFIVYTAASIASTFVVTAGMFGAMSLYGYTTKRDLSGFGNMLFMALIGIVLASLVNFWLKSEALMWAVTYIGVIVFVGLTAYDTQKLKNMGEQIDTRDTSNLRKYSILGALTLYLDFINLFLMLLRIDLIPLCHPLMLSKVEVNLQAEPEHNRVRIETLCRLTGKTGVEMEALTAASVAALTIYDMCKAVQKDMVIGPVRLLAKSGGKSGDFKVEADD